MHKDESKPAGQQAQTTAAEGAAGAEAASGVAIGASSWHSAFPRNMSQRLSDAVTLVEQVAQQLEILSQSDRYGPSKLQPMSVHAFYLKEIDKLHRDFATKAKALLAIRKGNTAEATGLSPEEYERMITSRLKELKPLVEKIIVEDTPFATSQAVQVLITRNEQLLQDINGLTAFFEDTPPSSFMGFTGAIKRGHLDDAERAVGDLSAPLPPPRKAR